MTRMQRWLRDAAVVVVLVGASGLVGHSQNNTIPQMPGPPSGSIPDMRTPSNPRSDVLERQSKMRNVDRQKRLEADTEKLLALATQLHADVAKTNANVLSLDVVRRAEEIEKLARGVKERMKG
jgi:hypothetical protein